MDSRRFERLLLLMVTHFAAAIVPPFPTLLDPYRILTAATALFCVVIGWVGLIAIGRSRLQRLLFAVIYSIGTCSMIAVIDSNLQHSTAASLSAQFALSCGAVSAYDLMGMVDAKYDTNSNYQSVRNSV